MCYTVAILACLIMHFPSGVPTRPSVRLDQDETTDRPSWDVYRRLRRHEEDIVEGWSHWVVSWGGTSVAGCDANICALVLGAFPSGNACRWRSLTPLAQAYDASKRLIRALTPSRTDSALSTGELASAGFLSAVPTTLVTAPVERAKVLLQVSYQL